MNWDTLNWKTLDRLRDGFLSGKAAEGPYWKSQDDLAHYDLTYAERIGWKWDAVLTELRLRGWSPRGGTLLDWGCGSGIAGRRILSAFGAQRFDSLLLWDHSPAAMDFASEAAEKAFPGLNTCAATPGFLEGAAPIGLLVISHVLNELSESALASLRRLILRSEAVIWVEAGTHEVARGLQTIRDSLLDSFAVVAPCPGQAACPMLTPENERHWCHFFAAPPSGIFADSNWVRFGQRAGIDLRSLPYAFLVLQQKGPTQAAVTTTVDSVPGSGDTLHRVIGRPEHLKPYARLLACNGKQLPELKVMKKGNGPLYKELEKTKAPLVYRWTVQDGEVQTVQT